MYCEMTLILGHYTYLRLSTHLLEHSPTYILLILHILTFALTSNDELCGLRLLGSVKFAFFLQGIQRNGAQRSTKSTWDLDLWNGIGVFWRFFLFREGVKGQSRAPGVFSWKLYSEFFWERTMRKQWCSFFHHFRMRKHWKVEYQSGATDDGWDHLCSLRFNASIRSQWLLIFGSYPVRVTRHVLLNEKKTSWRNHSMERTKTRENRGNPSFWSTEASTHNRMPVSVPAPSWAQRMI